MNLFDLAYLASKRIRGPCLHVTAGKLSGDDEGGNSADGVTIIVVNNGVVIDFSIVLCATIVAIVFLLMVWLLRGCGVCLLFFYLIICLYNSWLILKDLVASV